MGQGRTKFSKMQKQCKNLWFGKTNLMWINFQVIIGDSAADELAVEVVVSRVDVANAGIRVGVTVGASTEGAV